MGLKRRTDCGNHRHNERERNSRSLTLSAYSSIFPFTAVPELTIPGINKSQSHFLVHCIAMEVDSMFLSFDSQRKDSLPRQASLIAI